MMERTILVVDIETTSLKHTEGHIVEIGIVLLDLETGDTREIYDELVKEEGFSEEHADSWIFKNSDLKHADVMKAEPLNIDYLQDIFNKFAATAWNKLFDFGYLRSRGLQINDLPCPMLAMTRRGERWPSVMSGWKRLFPKKKYVELHRGLDDALHEARMVHELYKTGIFKVKNNND